MPKRGYRQTAEHKARIRASVAATRESSPEVAASRAMSDILNGRLLSALPGTVGEVTKATGMRRNYVRHRLGRLYAEGKITRKRGPGLGAAYRYERADT